MCQKKAPTNRQSNNFGHFLCFFLFSNIYLGLASKSMNALDSLGRNFRYRDLMTFMANIYLLVSDFQSNQIEIPVQTMLIWNTFTNYTRNHYLFFSTHQHTCSPVLASIVNCIFNIKLSKFIYIYNVFYLVSNLASISRLQVATCSCVPSRRTGRDDSLRSEVCFR